MVYYHDCKIADIKRHNGFCFSKMDNSVLYGGKSGFIEQNGEGYNINLEFRSKMNISLKKKKQKGISYHRYCSSGAFIECDWRHDE